MSLDLARDLAERGYYVFPARGKVPLTTHGFKDATRDERKILHLWERSPAANVGIDLGRSGCFVLDIDAKHGADPDDLLGEFNGAPVVRTGEAPEPSADVPRSLSGVRGAHVYFAGHHRTCKTRLQGVEIRGDGAYVMAPGSRHESGVLYAGTLPPVAKLPEAPEKVRALAPAPAAAPAVEGPIESGARNDTLASLAGTMRRRGMSEAAILEALRVENRRCRPPLDDSELKTIAKSVARYAPATERREGAAKVTAIAVTWDESKRPSKPVLPDAPSHDDAAALATWITAVLHLDRAHPVVAGVYQGLAGGTGHVELRRLDAPPIRFEPAVKIGNAARLAEALTWQQIATDEPPFPWTNPQATRIARVVRLLCARERHLTVAEETEVIVTTFLEAAQQVEGRTHATTGERYEAAVALRPPDGFERPRYLVDLDTDELVIRVSDLQRLARHIVGGTLAYGWLDARMEALGWERRTLEGRALPGRPGRRGPHARAEVYRGVLREVEDDDPVTT